MSAFIRNLAMAKQAEKKAGLRTSHLVVLVAASTLFSACAGINWPPAQPLNRGIQIRREPQASTMTLPSLDSTSSEPVLAAILRAAETRAPAVLAAAARTKSGQDGFDLARSEYWGEISLFVRDTQFANKRVIVPLSPPINIGSLPFDDNVVDVGLSGRLNLDLSGRIGANTRKAGWSRDATAFLEKNTRLTVLHAAATFYRDLQRIDGLETALEQQRRSLAAQVNIAIESVKLGRLAEVEQHRLEAALARVQGDLATLKSRRVAAKANLEAILAGPQIPQIPRPGVLPPIFAPSIELVADRPDLQAALAQLYAAGEAEEVALSRYKPELFLEGRLEHLAGADVQGNTIGQVSIGLEMPLFSGGRRAALLGIARSKRREALEELHRLEETARADYFTAQALNDSARTRYLAAKTGSEAAEKTAVSQRERFKIGRLSAADLVDTEAALARARGELSIAKVDVLAAVDLMHLTVGLEPMSYPSTQKKEVRP